MVESERPQCFVDTNIWLYAFVEAEDPHKTELARHVLLSVRVVLSTQVINEVCVNLLKFGILEERQIRDLVHAFYARYQVVDLTPVLLLQASSLRERYSLSFWDSLIVAGGVIAGVRQLYSEDMQHGLVLENGLEIVNPFLQQV